MKKDVKTGDIVQVSPEANHGREGQWFQCCMVTVSEVRDWGVQGYVQNAGQDGQAYIRLKWDEFEPTGGVAVWAVS